MRNVIGWDAHWTFASKGTNTINSMFVISANMNWENLHHLNASYCCNFSFGQSNT